LLRLHRGPGPPPETAPRDSPGATKESALREVTTPGHGRPPPKGPAQNRPQAAPGPGLGARPGAIDRPLKKRFSLSDASIWTSENRLCSLDMLARTPWRLGDQGRPLGLSREQARDKPRRRPPTVLSRAASRMWKKSPLANRTNLAPGPTARPRVALTLRQVPYEDALGGRSPLVPADPCRRSGQLLSLPRRASAESGLMPQRTRPRKSRNWRPPESMWVPTPPRELSRQRRRPDDVLLFRRWRHWGQGPRLGSPRMMGRDSAGRPGPPGPRAGKATAGGQCKREVLVRLEEMIKERWSFPPPWARQGGGLVGGGGARPNPRPRAPRRTPPCSEPTKPQKQKPQKKRPLPTNPEARAKSRRAELKNTVECLNQAAKQAARKELSRGPGPRVDPQTPNLPPPAPTGRDRKLHFQGS